MKKALLFFLIVISFQGNSQVVVANDLLRLVYVGIDNPISINVKSIPDNELIVTTKEGVIKKVESGKYAWTICNENLKIATLIISRKNRIIDSVRFIVKTLPEPQILIANQDDELIFKGVKAWAGLRAEITNFLGEDILCKIESFMILINKKNGQNIMIKNSGQVYAKEAVKSFQELEIGDRITLSDFLVFVGCETRPRQLKATFTQVYSGKKYEFRY